MKHFKPIIIYLSIFCFLTVSLLGMYPKKIYAEVPATQKAVAHNTTWGSLDWNYTFHRKYYTIEDATGIPTSLITAPYYFYTNDNVTFFAITGGDLIQTVLTNGLQLVLNPSKVSALTSAFFNAIKGPDLDYGKYAEGGLYDSNDNFLGYCLNDISGCYYYTILDQNSPNVTVPSDTVNNVFNFYKYYNSENPTYPDYITVLAPSNSLILNRYADISNNQPLQANISTRLNYATSNHQNLTNLTYNVNTRAGMPTDFFTFGDTYEYIPLDNVHYIGTNWGDQQFYNFCEYFDLDKTHTEFLTTEFLTLEPYYDGFVYAHIYDSNNQRISSAMRYSLIDGTQTSNKGNLFTGIGFIGTYNAGTGHYANFLAGQDYTIYKDQSTYESICINHNYSPDGFYGSIYNTFNTNNDNSFTCTINQIDNSTTINQTIYNDFTNDFPDYVDGSTVNNTDISNEITIEIEILFPTPNPDPTPDPDPDPDPDDPDSILDAILAALRRFFEIFGRLLGTVLAGLLEVIDTLLESIAGIMENLTGVTDFISALFSWIPSPVPEILGVGISICILAAIIKFIRG